MSDDVQVKIEDADDPNGIVRQMIEAFLAGLQAIGMERANAAGLMVVQGAIRLEKLADLEEMQRFINREVADWQEANESEDDGEEATDAGDALH